MSPKEYIKNKATGIYKDSILGVNILWKTKRKYVIATIIALVILLRYILSSGGGSTNMQQSSIIREVATGSIQDSIKIVGNAELTQEQRIRFNQLGKVNGVYVKVGDKVQRGDIIATLDQTTALNNIRQAQIDLENAKLRLAQIKDTNQADQIQSAQNNLDTLHRRFDVIQREYDLLLIEEEKLATDKQEDIDQLYNNNALLQRIMLDIKNSIAESRIAVENIDSIFGITTKYNTSEYYILLSAKDTVLKNKTESYVHQAYTALNDLQTWYDNNANGTGSEEIGLKLSENTHRIIYDLLDTAYNALENSVTSVDLSQNMLDQYKNRVSSDRNKTKATLDSIISFQDQLSNGSNISDIEYNYKRQSDNLALQKIAKQNDMQGMMADIAAAEKTLQDAQDGNNQIEIQIQENAIQSASINVENRTKELENLQITSPIDGTIRKIDFKVGDNLTNDTESYVYIENPNLVQVTALVDQIDIVKMQVGQSVNIVFDSHPNSSLTGYLQEIDTSPNETAGVVSYTITVTLDKGNLKIYGGMTAKMDVFIHQENNVLVLPTQFIQEENGRPFVLMQDGKADKKVFVTIGLETSTTVEIISGLTAGDKVIRYITASANNNAPAVFGAGPSGGVPGGFGGGNPGGGAGGGMRMRLPQ